MNNLTIILLMGIGLGLISSARSACENKYLTIAIDNSDKTSNETFINATKMVMKLLEKNSNSKGNQYYNLKVSIHTFGSDPYTEEEVSFTWKTDELQKGLKKMTYHGNQAPNPSHSITHFSTQKDSKGKGIFLYIGKGDTIKPAALKCKALTQKKKTGVFFITVRTAAKKLSDEQNVNLERLATPSGSIYDSAHDLWIVVRQAIRIVCPISG